MESACTQIAPRAYLLMRTSIRIIIHIRLRRPMLLKFVCAMRKIICVSYNFGRANIEMNFIESSPINRQFCLLTIP
jgi:hypothetical protein